MEVVDDLVGSWIPLRQPGSVATSHSCSECECVEHCLPLPGRCPNCNATMMIPAEADEVAIGRLMGSVQKGVSLVALVRSSIRPPGMRLDERTRRPAW